MKIKTLIASAAVAALIVGTAATAHAAGPSTMTKMFVEKVPVANQFEIDSSKLALDKSQNDDVKQFAQKMVDDHTKAGEDFTTALSSSGVDPSLAPTALDKQHQKIIDKLTKDDAASFDKDYIKAQTDAHKDAVALFTKYSEKGDNESLKTFATNTLPTLKDHKSMIDTMGKTTQ